MSEKQWLNLDKVLDWLFPVFLIEVFCFRKYWDNFNIVAWVWSDLNDRE